MTANRYTKLDHILGKPKTKLHPTDDLKPAYTKENPSKTIAWLSGHEPADGRVNTRSKIMGIPQERASQFRPILPTANTRLSVIFIREEHISKLPGLQHIETAFLDDARVPDYGGLVIPVLVRTLKPRKGYENSKPTIRAEFDQITNDFLFGGPTDDDLKIPYVAAPLGNSSPPRKMHFFGRVVETEVKGQKKEVEIPAFISKIIRSHDDNVDKSISVWPKGIGTRKGKWKSHGSEKTLPHRISGTRIRWRMKDPAFGIIQKSPIGSFVLLEIHAIPYNR